MKALKIAGVVSLCDVGGDLKSLRSKLLGGDVSTIGLIDGGVMIVDANGQQHGKPYNQLASLVAHTAVYGIALIVGADDANDEFDDVPGKYLALLSCGDQEDAAH